MCSRCHGNKNVNRNRHARHVSLKTKEVGEAFNGWPTYREVDRTVDPKKLCGACEWSYARQKQMWLCKKCRVKFKVDKIEFTDDGPRHLEEYRPDEEE